MSNRASFHVHLYGPRLRNPRLEGPSGGDVEPTGRETAPIPTSFEAARDRLNDFLPAVLFEPDGSFAWTGPNHQLVGMIYDAAGAVQYVELRGHCDRRQLRTLVETLSGTAEIDDFALMLLPERQWKSFQSFERLLLDPDPSA